MPGDDLSFYRTHSSLPSASPLDLQLHVHVLGSGKSSAGGFGFLSWALFWGNTQQSVSLCSSEQTFCCLHLFLLGSCCHYLTCLCESGSRLHGFIIYTVCTKQRRSSTGSMSSCVVSPGDKQWPPQICLSICLALCQPARSDQLLSCTTAEAALAVSLCLVPYDCIFLWALLLSSGWQSL